MKVVINTCFGGFGLSKAATQWLYEQGVEGIATPIHEYFGGPGSKFYDSHDDFDWEERKNTALAEWRSGKGLTQFSLDEKFCLYARDVPRTHPKLIECIEKFGKDANDCAAKLKVVEIPEEIEWEIDESDGIEHVAQKHERWS